MSPADNMPQSFLPRPFPWHPALFGRPLLICALTSTGGCAGTADVDEPSADEMPPGHAAGNAATGGGAADVGGTGGALIGQGGSPASGGSGGSPASDGSGGSGSDGSNPIPVDAKLIEYALEDKGTMCFVEAGGGSISTVNDIVRAGNIAHQHTVSTNYKRAEIDDCSWHKYDAKGNVFWYGASYYLPSGSFGDDINTYVTQMRFSNIHEGGASQQNCTTRACGQGGGESGSGHHLKVNKQRWEFTLRYQDPNCAPCRGTLQQKFDLGPISTDKWTDFVFEAKWSHETDGYLNIWKQVSDGGYDLIISHQGRTWFDKYADGSNREGQDVKAPNYTVGLYYSTKTDTRIMYTDEIRVFQQQPGVDGFALVAPGQNGK